MRNSGVWLDGIIAAIVVMAVIGWLLLRKFGIFILLLIICILLLTRCGFPVVKNIKYTTPKQSITSYPVVFVANISLGDGTAFQAVAVVYNDPKSPGPVDYVIFWWSYPREIHSVFYKKGDQWYWKVIGNKPKKINDLSIGGQRIF